MPAPAHKRIDEGIPRGPRLKPGRKPRSPRRNNGDFLPILPNSPEQIAQALQAYCDGATLKQIGQQYGVTRQAVYGWLLGELGGEQHSALVTRSLTARIAKGDETLDSADNALDLARGREQARNARLDLERRRAHLYGPKQEVAHTGPAPIFQVNVVNRPIIDVQPVAEPQQNVIAAPLIEVSK